MKNIFVGNLDFSTTEDSLRPLFEAYGTVDRLRVMMDRDTGRSRGFAFVVMANTDEGERAIAALNGAVQDGRAMNVNEARPQTSAGAGAGGGHARGPGGGGGPRPGGDRAGGSRPGGDRRPSRERREPRW